MLFFLRQAEQYARNHMWLNVAMSKDPFSIHTVFSSIKLVHLVPDYILSRSHFEF